MSARYTANDIAEWFLAYNQQFVDSGGAELVSNLKLQKLLYYAQGASLAIFDEPLFDDPILAWQHGPVVEEVYHNYKSFGASGIEVLDFDSVPMNEDVEELLGDVYDTFGKYSAWQLRNMTHEEKPWIETESIGDEFDLNIMKKYFEDNYLTED